MLTKTNVIEEKCRVIPKCTFPEDLLEDLEEFRRFCDSCQGPRGNLKIIVSETGAFITTSSFSRFGIHFSYSKIAKGPL